jgi:hypothetical protein
MIAESNTRTANYEPNLLVANRFNLDKSLRLPQFYSREVVSGAFSALRIPLAEKDAIRRK